MVKKNINETVSVLVKIVVLLLAVISLTLLIDHLYQYFIIKF